MGATSSKSKLVVVSLDALGTIYKLREPVAVQYSKVARRCGFQGRYDTRQLNQSFKTAFKEHYRLYPNYGKGQLPNPGVWWQNLVEKTFKPFVTAQAPLPPQTGQELYKHFTSGDAYELFPDVKPFLELMSSLKHDFKDPEGPSVLTGIISSSDPRVRNVRTSLGLQVGVPEDELSMRGLADSFKTARATGRVATPVSNMYKSRDHFNFLTTSYDVGHEKPDLRIFSTAEFQAQQVLASRVLKNHELPRSMRGIWSVAWKTSNSLFSECTLIHIGDDYENDYLGADESGYEALLLDREGKHGGKENVVTSLEEAGKVVSILTHESFRSYL